MKTIANTLSDRYASSQINAIWHPEEKIRLERRYWIAILKAQKELGLDIPADAISAYESAVDSIDLDAIAAREAKTKHDVKARIEAFCEAAGHEHIHKGLTSRDLTENIEQLQIFKSLQSLQQKVLALLSNWSAKSLQYKDFPLSARTHNVAAQLTTLGKRFAMWAEELLLALDNLDHLLAHYPFRGLKGAVGTQLDQLQLFEGDADKVKQLEQKVLEHLGAPSAFRAVGQVYPRSLDFQVVATLYQIACPINNFATTLRLMAGHELASEGFAKGQTGSSAVPHKMNARSAERIQSFCSILKGHLTMVADVAGSQWNEGDVACSAARRVIFPDAFFTIDGILETALTITGQMQFFPEVIDAETARYLPFLLTSQVLMESVKAGAGRETAHAAIKEHAVAAISDLRSGSITTNDLFKRFAADERIPLDEAQLQSVFDNGPKNLGNATQQVEEVAAKIKALGNIQDYEPEPIL